MTTTKKNIKNVQKTVHLLRDIENEKLYQLLNSISEELGYLKNGVNSTITKQAFEALRDKMFRLVKREHEFILPYIDKLLYKKSNHEADTMSYYRNLAMPVKKLITDHHEIFSKLEELKERSYNFSYLAEDNFEYTKILSDLFDLYQLFEKHLYLEENILFPQLVQLFENAADDTSEIEKTYSHVAA